MHIQAELQSKLCRLTGYNGQGKAPKIGLAVSGGPDSLALLWLMKKYYNGTICAATVDHGLRIEARQEAAHVAVICASQNITHNILHPETAISGNIQSKAREARYALLQKWALENDCDFLATAHHADDQLETIIMRLNRGSGVSGLASIRERNGNIIRPLLSFHKSDLIKVCEDADLPYIEDPSNDEDDYDRVRVRKWLAHINNVRVSNELETLFHSKMVQKSAQNLAHAEQALQYSAENLADLRLTKRDNIILLDAADLPYEYIRRLLLIALRQLSPDISPRGEAMDNLITSLKSNTISMIADIKCTPQNNNNGDSKLIWRLELAPPRRH